MTLEMDNSDVGPAAFSLEAMFAPLQVRNIVLKNRFVMPAMQRGWNEEGSPLPRLAVYYRRRVEGGTALIISESCAVDHPSSTQAPTYARISTATSDAWKRCVQAVREEGGQFFLQLWHEGAVRQEGGDGPYSAHPTLSPSGFATPSHANGRAATQEELLDIRESFIEAAILAKEIGVSGVEIHCAHGFLLDQFLWGETNRRDDGYGGADMRHRARFPAEIVSGIRSEVGEDFVISLRFSQWKEADYSARIAKDPEELQLMLSILREAGVDIFHASARRFWIPEWEGSDLGIAGSAKSLTDAKVIAVGSVGLDVDVMENLGGVVANATGIASFQELERRFGRGDFDLFSVGRGQIADPDWVSKIRDGKVAQIRTFKKEHLAEPEPPGRPVSV